MRPAKYYDKILKEIDPDMYEDIMSERELQMSNLWEENTELRLSQKEKVKEAQFNQLKRSL